MKIEKSNSDKYPKDLLIIKSNKFHDNRGWFQESYHLNFTVIYENY